MNEDFDEELDKDLEKGYGLAKELVKHLRAMNAAVLAIPVTIEGEKYEVTAAPEGNTEQALTLLEFVRIRREQRKHETGAKRRGHRKVELRGHRSRLN